MKKGNLIGIILILIITICSIFTLIFLKFRPTSNTISATISVNGKVFQTIDLSSLNEETTFTVTTPSGDENIICARKGEIAIIKASCPDQICVQRGFVSDSLLPIVCLPNKVTVEIHTTRPHSSDAVDFISN